MRRAIVPVLLAFVAGLLLGAYGPNLRRTETRSDRRPADLAAIERLRQRDIDVTYTQRPEELASVFSDDAVNLVFPTPAVGSKAIKEAFEKFHSEYPEFQVLKYKSELKSIQLLDDWAIEVTCSEASYRLSANAAQVDVPETQGMRLLKKQSDGSWKFALVGLK